MSNPSRLRTSVECRIGRLVGCGPAKRGSWIGFLVAALAIVGAIDDVHAQPSSGACCLPNGTCTVTNDPFVCDQQNGIFRGNATCAGVVCTGACCIANGSCTSGSSQSCTSAAGEFKGFGSLCANQICGGACCLPNKSCTETGPSGCASVDGLFQGLGTICGDECPVAMPTAFTYQGQLKRAGVPLNGPIDARFSLWLSPTGQDPSDQIGSTLLRNAIEVVNGLFSVELDFGQNAFNGNARWLQVEIHDHDDPPGTLTTLSPRQALTPTPYALQTRGIVVREDGNVGIGTASPEGRFEVASGTNSYVRIDNAFGDLHFNGGSNGVFGLFNDSGATGSTSIYGQGVPRLVVVNTGRVGINTGAPVRPLHVFDGGQYTARFESTNNTAATIEIRDASSNATWEIGVIGSAQPLGLPTGSLYILKQGQPTQGLSITPGGGVLVPGTLDIGIEDIVTPPTETQSIILSCPPGKFALSGGCVCTAGQIYLSRPEGSGWFCACSDTTFGTERMTAYVRCARVR